MSYTIRTSVAYFGCYHLDHARNDFDEIAQICDRVVLPMSEADLRWSHGTVRDLVTAAHESGLEVWLDPWGVGGVFGGEAFSGFVGEFPGECQITNHGARLPRACPNSEQFRALLHTWIGAAAETGADAIFWDEPHFWTDAWSGELNRWACCCDRCRILFFEASGESLEEASSERLAFWQATALRELLADLTVVAHDQGLRNAVCLLPTPEHADSWPAIAALPYVHNVGTDPYWFTFHQPNRAAYVGGWARRLLDVTRAARKRHHLWLQAFRVPAGAESQIEEMVELAAGLGVREFAVWGYRGCANMSSIASADPDATWQTVTRSFRRLRESSVR